ncbi:MAG: dTDP-4-dehydrorhamnose 3,5-epimerase [Crocinitomicaceae bacterium]|nr:dTDP-4-dehydrorhamnose 3,5-epimerase [Crocinitomicaceae bacterium]
MVEKEEIALKGITLIKPKVYNDNRGLFLETFNLNKFEKQTGFETTFYQDNLSVSKKNVLRGLHFQKPPNAQGKLVQVIKGRAIDVAVDIRKNSPTYGAYFKVELNDINRYQLWIPRGFAHGFVALEDNTIFSYKCDNPYSQKDEMSLPWNDEDLAIEWGVKNPILSNKDESATTFKRFNSPF